MLSSLTHSLPLGSISEEGHTLQWSRITHNYEHGYCNGCSVAAVSLGRQLGSTDIKKFKETPGGLYSSQAVSDINDWLQAVRLPVYKYLLVVTRQCLV